MKLLGVLALCLGLTSATVEQGITHDLKNQVGMAFLGKFAYEVSPKEADHDPTKIQRGTFNITFTLPEGADPNADEYKHLEVYIFSDEDHQWPAIYGNSSIGTNCEYVRDLSKAQPPYQVTFVNGKYNVQSPPEGIRQSTRRRNWFYVMGKCDAHTFSATPAIQFHSEFLNSDYSDWSKQFGTNFVGLNTMFLVFFMVFLPFSLLHFYGVFQLRTKLQFMHPMVKMFAFVVLLELVVITCKMVNWMGYSKNGMGVVPTLLVAEICDIVARSVFILIMMLMAKGWTISGDELTGKPFVFLSVGIYFGFALLISLLKEFTTDPAAVTIPAGVSFLLVTLDILWFFLAGWFVFTVHNSWSNEDNPVKKALYRNIAIIYTIWFFGLPVCALLDMILMDWVRTKVVELGNTAVNLIGYAVLSYLLWPSRAEEYFSISTPDVMRANIDTYEQL
jgi:hypothetical protein